MEKNTTIALVGMLLSLMIPTNLYIYGQEYNESLAYKYGNTTDKLKIEREYFFDSCSGTSSSVIMILFEDKCKPVIKYYENLGWFADFFGTLDVGKSERSEAIGLSSPLSSGRGCVEERFQNHLLLSEELNPIRLQKLSLFWAQDDCQKVIQYYLSNGYDLVDKYDKKVELIKGQAPSALNSSQLDPR